jgi:hypothetical protein
MTSAPKALSKTRRSIDMDSGMVSFSLYPFAAATMARPMPVFPEVGSTRTVFPGVISPRASASVIMLKAMRSFTEFAGLLLSNLTTTSATLPSVTRLSLTRGVLPISSRTLLAILAAGKAVEAEGTERGTNASLVERRVKRAGKRKRAMFLLSQNKRVLVAVVKVLGEGKQKICFPCPLSHVHPMTDQLTFLSYSIVQSVEPVRQRQRTTKNEQIFLGYVVLVPGMIGDCHKKNHHNLRHHSFLAPTNSNRYQLTSNVEGTLDATL